MEHGERGALRCELRMLEEAALCWEQLRPGAVGVGRGGFAESAIVEKGAGFEADLDVVSWVARSMRRSRNEIWLRTWNI